MVEQRELNFFGDLKMFEGLFKDLPAPREMAAHDRMIDMRFAERLAGIFDIGAEKFRGQLIFHFLEARAVGVTKEKADHTIGKHPVDEAIDDFPQLDFAAEAFEKSFFLAHEMAEIKACLIVNAPPPTSCSDPRAAPTPDRSEHR